MKALWWIGNTARLSIASIIWTFVIFGLFVANDLSLPPWSVATLFGVWAAVAVLNAVLNSVYGPDPASGAG